MPVTPFVVGQWVHGEKFYGRTVLIDEILRGPRNWLWLLGTRRIGKTSLLKQVEHITSNTKECGYFPVFWDFQGAANPRELRDGFGEALLDAQPRLEDLGVRLEEVEHDDLFRSLGLLRRGVRAKGLKLLLLCDEVEELISLNRMDSSLLRKLRRVMQSQDDIRSVLASTIRLWALAEQRDDTSPFLHGFTPPLYIHTLSGEEARALICQANLPGDSRPRIDDDAVETIRAHCDNHPYLIQLVSKRYVESGNLEEALEQVATDGMVSHFFSVDFDMLSPTERNIIRIIAEHTSSTSNSIQDNLFVAADHLNGLLHRLVHLGYIRRDEERRFVLANYFFRRWFLERPGDSPTTSSPRPSQERTLSLPALEELFGDRYTVLAQIGRGATGVVYKARDKKLDVDIAIKHLRAEYASHPEAAERFRQEIVLARNIGHPNIVRIYDLGEFGERRFLTMQWVEGNLAKTIEELGPLPLPMLVAIGRKLASAMEALHGAGVLHRDIKPQNILLDRNHEPYLTDFGLARLLGRTGLTRHGVFLGTPDYVSPEQADGETLDERSDVYSFGVVLFEMATGGRPFRGRTSKEVLDAHKTAPPPVPSAVRPAIPAGLSNLILRCLAKEPQDRFKDASELRRALETL